MKTTLPAVLTFSDYHEIPFFADNLREIIPKAKVYEVGTAGRDYYAIAYVGRKDASIRR